EDNIKCRLRSSQVHLRPLRSRRSIHRRVLDELRRVSKLFFQPRPRCHVRKVFQRDRRRQQRHLRIRQRLRLRLGLARDGRLSSAPLVYLRLRNPRKHHRKRRSTEPQPNRPSPQAQPPYSSCTTSQKPFTNAFIFIQIRSTTQIRSKRSSGSLLRNAP